MKECPSCARKWPDETLFCPYDGAPLGNVVAEDSPEGGQLGNYRIVKRLAEGGIGTVYLAEHLRLKRHAAIKILNRYMAADSESLARFEREARVAARIQHPNVCTIYDIGQTSDRRPYLAMEYVEGRSLSEILDADGSLDPERAASFSIQVARALQAAHSLGIVHRDLKPGNIMISTAKHGVETVKVVDFGIAKAFEAQSQGLTHTGMVIGTPEYMSPEQATGAQAGPQSDLYSLALVHFRMLTGSLPFRANTSAETLVARLTHPPLRLREARRGLVTFHDLESVLARALERDPRDRYPDAESFAAAVSKATSIGIEASRRQGITGKRVVEPGVFGWFKRLFLRPSEARPDSPARTPAVLAADEEMAKTGTAEHGARPTTAGDDTGQPSATTAFSTTQASDGEGDISLGEFARNYRPPEDQVQSPAPSPAIEPDPVKPGEFTRIVASPQDRVPAHAQPPGIEPDAAEPGEFTRVFHSPQDRMAIPAAPPGIDPDAAEPGEFTRIFRPPEDWVPPTAPPPELEADAAEPGEDTRLFALPRPTPGPSTFPVALTVVRALDPSIVGMRHECDHFPFTVGRADGADLCIPSDSVLSRIHVEVDQDERGYLVRDVSTNGIWVAGRRLKERSEPLYFGTTLDLSKETAIMFVADIPVLPDVSGELLEGRYRLESRLHNSVKAATYRSQDTRFDRPVAIKIFTPSLMRLGPYHEEFQRQARLAARLQHGHICRVLDHGTTQLRIEGKVERCSWLCMELMEGGNLEHRLKRELPSVDALTDWIDNLADALEHSHRNGIVHGALKPASIVFDRDGAVYITDFALARSNERESSSAVIGTPAYLAPEQWEGGQATAATDQYSLAVLAYQMVTGRRPFEGQTNPDVRAVNFERGPLPAHEQAHRIRGLNLPEAVSSVLAKALSPDPAARYRGPLEFSRALQLAFAEPDRTAHQPRVFISYRRRVAAPWAIHFATILQDKHGCSVFVDTRSMDGAPQIPTRVRSEIERCDVFVCLLAPGTLDSDWVRQEIGIACDCGKPMVPIFFQEFDPRDVDTSADTNLKMLMDYEAVRLYDRDAVYVDAAIVSLNDRIRSFL